MAGGPFSRSRSSARTWSCWTSKCRSWTASRFSGNSRGRCPPSSFQTLQAIDERFSGTQFQRVHRSVLVNLDKIRKISTLSSQRWLLTLTNGPEYTVSKRQAPLLRDMLRKAGLLTGGWAIEHPG